MHFKNKKHGSAFEEVFGTLDRKNYSLLAAVYLLTADADLWRRAVNAVSKYDINFGNINLANCGRTTYTLCAAAEDLFTGSTHLPLRDLADPQIIQPISYRLICCAMDISRKGIKSVWLKSERFYIDLEDTGT